MMRSSYRSTALLLCTMAVLAACGSGGSSGSGSTGIRGHVVAGPSCPVIVEGSPCPPRPVQTTVRVLDAEGSEVASGPSASDGSFRIEVAPGRYTVEAVPAPDSIQTSRPVPVTVGAAGFTQVTVPIDSGIR